MLMAFNTLDSSAAGAAFSSFFSLYDFFYMMCSDNVEVMFNIKELKKKQKDHPKIEISCVNILRI